MQLNNNKILLTWVIKFLLSCLFIFSLSAFAGVSQPDAKWLQEFKHEALQAGVTSKTFKSTLKHARLLPRVVQLDRAQPEFISPFLGYISSRVTQARIAQGRGLMQIHADLLAATEAQYGVPANLLVAFWGMETNYGSNQGDFGLPSTLMTLAYDGRRAAFFRSQLVDVMRIVQAGHMPVKALRGSWAGAFGHMQFMPSTMLRHGVDADSNGKINLKDSIPDVFASAANYLRNAGWKKDQPAMLEVSLPNGFDYASAQLMLKKSTAEWTNLGVSQINGEALPLMDQAAILLPQGWQGPAIMVFPNFEVVMDWNRSVNYALSVLHLADNLIEDRTLQGGVDAETGALSFNQMWALQLKLNSLGFDCGPPDGFPGLKTQTAIRQYQASQQLPQDGYASPSLLELLMSSD